MGKWINFEEQPSKGITKIFKVTAKEGGDNLGTIKWFTSWRCYSFQPEAGTIFEADCLSDVTSFLKDLMENRKKIKESNMKHLKEFSELNEGLFDFVDKIKKLWKEKHAQRAVDLEQSKAEFHKNFDLLDDNGKSIFYKKLEKLISQTYLSAENLSKLIKEMGDYKKKLA